MTVVIFRDQRSQWRNLYLLFYQISVSIIIQRLIFLGNQREVIKNDEDFFKQAQIEIKLLELMTSRMNQNPDKVRFCFIVDTPWYFS